MADGGVVRFTRKGMGKSTSAARGDVLLRSVPAIRGIIEKGSIVHREPGNREGVIERLVISAPVEVLGQVRQLAVSVHKTADGRYHYDLHGDRETGGLGIGAQLAYRGGPIDSKESAASSSDLEKPRVDRGGRAEGTLPSLEVPQFEAGSINLAEWAERFNAPQPFYLRQQAGGTDTEFLLTEEFVAKAAEIGAALRDQLDRMGLKDVGLRVSERIRAVIGGQSYAIDGQYFKGLIDVALDGPNPSTTLGHEAIHAMRRMHLFTDGELSILERKSRSAWMTRYDIAGTGYGSFPEWIQVEEGIAHAYADWLNGKQFDGVIVRSFKRIKALIEALTNALQGAGFTSTDAIFRAVDEGRVGERPRDERGRFVSPAAYSLAGRISPDTKPLDAPKALLGERLTEAVAAMKARSKQGRPLKDDGEGLSDYLHRKWVDYLHPLKMMQERAGGPKNDMQDAYLQARLAEDAALAQIQANHDKYAHPLVSDIAASGLTIEEVHEYLYALHAEERNRVVGLRNPDDSELFRAVADPSITGASGMSTNEARATIGKLTADPKRAEGLKRAAKHVRAMLDQSLRDQRAAGLISTETFELLTRQWKNYVPLMGQDGHDLQGNWRPARGRGFDVRGKEWKGAAGRFSKADNVIVNAIDQVERSILRQKKNEIGKALLRFINEFDPAGEHIAEVYWADDSELLDITKVEKVYRRELGAGGKVINRSTGNPFANLDEAVAVKVGGRAYFIRFKDPKVGRALKQLYRTEMGPVFRLLRQVTHWQSLVNTRTNPAFVIPNIIRDATTGGIHLLDEGFTLGEVVRISANIPKASAALWRRARGKPGKGEWDRTLDEYASAGGRITFDKLRFVEDDVLALRKSIERIASGNPERALWRETVKLIEDLNDAGENGMRLAAYAAAREKACPTA
jgi:hypothetical protein